MLFFLLAQVKSNGHHPDDPIVKEEEAPKDSSATDGSDKDLQSKVSQEAPKKTESESKKTESKSHKRKIVSNVVNVTFDFIICYLQFFFFFNFLRTTVGSCPFVI